MKKIFFILPFLLGLMNIFYAQKIGEKVTTPFNRIKTITIVDNGRLFAGTESGGLYYSGDNGITWVNITFPKQRVDMIYKCTNGDLYVHSYLDGLYRLRNNANMWTYVGFQDIIFGQMIESSMGYLLAIASSYNSFVYDGVYTLYLSKDNGASWKYIRTQFDQLNTSIGMKAVKHPNGVIYLVGIEGLYKSYTGEFWGYLHPGTLYSAAICTDGSIYIILSDLLRVSYDEGNSWTYILDTQSPVEFRNVFRDQNDGVYVTTSSTSTDKSQLYTKPKNTDTWTLLGELNGDNGRSYGAGRFQCASNGDIFYLDNSYAGSLYKISNSITSISKNQNLVPNTYNLSQNYPNPFNPTTIIEFSIPLTKFVTLKVFDLLGRELSTLVNEEKLPGNYEIKFNGTCYPSGVYFYRLQAGSFSQTKKLILLK